MSVVSPRQALEVVLQWGPERSVPELERLRISEPDATDDELTEALGLAQRVLSRAEALAPRVKMGSVLGTQIPREEFPWITDDLAARAIQQGMFFHWRDTGE